MKNVNLEWVIAACAVAIALAQLWTAFGPVTV